MVGTTEVPVSTQYPYHWIDIPYLRKTQLFYIAVQWLRMALENANMHTIMQDSHKEHFTLKY